MATFHGADTDADFLADILARIVARMLAFRAACHRNNFRKSRMSDVSTRILARMSVSVSASWNSSLWHDSLLYLYLPATDQCACDNVYIHLRGVISWKNVLHLLPVYNYLCERFCCFILLYCFCSTFLDVLEYSAVLYTYIVSDYASFFLFFCAEAN